MALGWSSAGGKERELSALGHLFPVYNAQIVLLHQDNCCVVYSHT